MNPIEIKSALSEILGCAVEDFEKVGAGGNSRVYRVSTGNGVYAAKFYFQQTVDGLDRLEVEFSAQSFLWNNGIRCIPRPLVADRDKQIAVYEYVSGREIPSEEVSDGDIDQMTAFISRLDGLAGTNPPADLPNAAEASFSIARVVSTIEARLAMLSAIAGEGVGYSELHEFLAREFAPALRRISERAEKRAGPVAYSTEIPMERRTLSPSDFGFHNALRRDGGEIVFLDFEYFGWDDPAKMICDYLLHPRTATAVRLKNRFVQSAVEGLSRIAGISERIEIVYPLFGLKWCVILLNEFRPEYLARREFASAAQTDRIAVRMEQLSKARSMLKRVIAELEHFPYSFASAAQ